MRQVNDALGAVVLDELRRDRVHGVGQGVFERDHLPVFLVAVVRAPAWRIAARRKVDAGFLVGKLVARLRPQAQGRRVHKRLERRSDLPAALAHVVVLEVLEVDAAYPSFDVACGRLHGDQTRVQNRLPVQDAVHRRQDGVHGPTVREDLHGHRLLEKRAHLLVGPRRPCVAAPALFPVAEMPVLSIRQLGRGDVESRAVAGRTKLANALLVAVRVAHGDVEDGLSGFRFDVLEKRCHVFGSVAQVTLEACLQFAREVAVHGVFGVGLHPAVDRGDDAKAVPVDVVGRAVRLRQHVLAVPILLREHLLQFGTKRLTEIGRGAFVVAHALELQPEGQGLQGICDGLFEVAVFGHLTEHDVATVLHQFRAAKRIEQGAVFEHAHQHRRLLDVELRSRFVEVDVRRALNADSLVDEVVAVEVERDDLLLGVVPFEARGDDPLLGFLQHRPLEETGRLVLVGEEEFGELLRHRRPAAALAHEGDGTRQANEVNARVVVKARVLRADQGVHEVGRKGLVPGVGTVFRVVPPEDFAVHRIDAGGKVGFGVGQGFRFRQITQAGEHHQSPQTQQRPESEQPQQQLPGNALHGSKMQRAAPRRAALWIRCEHPCVNSSRARRRRCTFAAWLP